MLFANKLKALTKIRINNKSVKINFDMVKLSQLVKDYSFMSLPKIQWLKNSTTINIKAYDS